MSIELDVKEKNYHGEYGVTETINIPRQNAFLYVQGNFVTECYCLEEAQELRNENDGDGYISIHIEGGIYD